MFVVVLIARFSNPEFSFAVHGDPPVINDFEAASDDALGRNVRRQVRLDEKQVLSLVGEYVAGSSVRELVKQWGVHRTTVISHLERAGVERRPNMRKMTD